MSKVVIVNYAVQDAFKVPKGINLEDKAQVKWWGVKWNRLHIELVDGTMLQINSEWQCLDFDYKHPSDDPTIEDAEDYGLEDEDQAYSE